MCVEHKQKEWATSLCQYIADEFCSENCTVVAPDISFESLELDSICIMEMVIYCERLTGGKVQASALTETGNMSVNSLLESISFDKGAESNASS